MASSKAKASKASKADKAEKGDREDLDRLGSFIRSQRRLAELSQRELAKLTDLSDPYVSQLERGLHEPSIRVLKSLANALNVLPETLLEFVGVSGSGEGADVSVETAIVADEALTDTQKQALLEVYRSFLAQ